jgi:hypothetical protein
MCSAGEPSIDCDVPLLSPPLAPASSIACTAESDTSPAMTRLMIEPSASGICPFCGRPVRCGPSVVQQTPLPRSLLLEGRLAVGDAGLAFPRLDVFVETRACVRRSPMRDERLR